MSTIWLIGASSGIGRALAEALAQAGHRLVLSSRNAAELQTLVQTLGERVCALPLDVTEAQSVQRVAQEAQAKLGHIDRVIFMAGTYTPMDSDALDLAQCRQIIDVNVMGALYVVHAVLPLLKQQQKGQIVLCGSVAGYGGLPGGQPYCASKAAIINLAESLYVECKHWGIDVKLISPGFVKTRLTDKNTFPMPMMITPQAAAQAILKGLDRSAFEIHFPKAFTRVMKLLSLLPIRQRAFFLLRRKA